MVILSLINYQDQALVLNYVHQVSLIKLLLLSQKTHFCQKQGLVIMWIRARTFMAKIDCIRLSYSFSCLKIGFCIEHFQCLLAYGEGASLALVGNPSSYGVTIKMPYEVDVLHGPASHPIFSYWVG